MSPRSAMSRTLLAGGLAAAVAALAELRIGRADRAETDRWSTIPVAPARGVELGLSFRPRQAEALGLDVAETLDALLAYPFPVIRLAAYWDRMERADGGFDTTELDWQLDAAERAGKEAIVCLGPVKAFGYPEYFVPPARLSEPLPEGRLVDENTHPELLAAVTDQLTRVVRRYQDRRCVRAWQVEHEAADPLGMEHSWRLSTSFIRREVDSVRAADPSRPVLMNGFLPTSTAVLAQQWWRTRDQGDSLVVAQDLADIVGLDVYPRHALVGFGRWSVYLEGARGLLPSWRRRRLLDRARSAGREVVVTEGQAEPWETVTVPPSPDGRVPFSCPPERIIENYNECQRWLGRGRTFGTYLFWGAEYWVQRQRQGDPRYLEAFGRVLERS